MQDDSANLTPEMFRPAAKDSQETGTTLYDGSFYWFNIWMRLKHNKLAMAGLFIVGMLTVMAIIGPYLTGFSYYEQDLTNKNLAPGSEHWFGTDSAGRDLFTRCWYGARISLFIGIAAALFDLVIGVLYGGISGIKGGWVDNAMMRMMEVLYSIPYLLLVILLMVVLGPGLWTMIAAMTITGWIPMARLVRGQVFQLKQQEFVIASYALGATAGWILRRHIVPNMLGTVLVHLTLTIPSAIFTEAALSFLGLGISAPMSSWGTLANDALEGILIGNLFPLFIPGFFISLTIFAFHAVGDGIRDALAPALRQSTK